MKENENTTFEKSSGNVFADMGCTDADEKLTKANIAINIARVIENRGLTQNEAARILGIDQPSVSKLVRGQLREFSTSRLLEFMRRLDHDVKIIFKPTTKSRIRNHTGGRISVEAR